MANKELSILMPSYNNTCVALVKELAAQCSNIEGLRYEIIVADDGSSKYSAVSRNREITKWVNCQFIERGINKGRAAIRNFLAQTAQYDTLLFLDSDVKVEKDDFILDYVDAGCNGVVYGGIHNDEEAYDRDNLRCVYECAFELKNTSTARNTRPYQSFRTTNFMALKKVMLDFPFDEGFTEYGYEDVLFGKTLRENGIEIKHIDNPVIVDDYDTNADFIDKTQQALRTLHKFRKDLEGYSGILTLSHGINRCCMSPMVHLAYKMYGKRLYRRLCTGKPSIMMYNIYRIMYYMVQPDKPKY